MNKAFIFPGLRHLGYQAGMSIPVTAELRSLPDAEAELSLFQDGMLTWRSHRRLPQSPATFLREWEASWTPTLPAPTDTDLFVLRLVAPSAPARALPGDDVEGQMMFRHPKGWTSSLLTGFIPARPPGHRYAPVIHTAHYLADPEQVDTVTLFANLASIDATDRIEAGTMTAQVQARDGTALGETRFSVLGNATVAVSIDEIARRCPPAVDRLREGINIKFFGGASQFSIVTLFRHRATGSIGMEHSLAPLYYLPGLRDPAVRGIVYSQLDIRS